jgi:hypothetical protein
VVVDPAQWMVAVARAVFVLLLGCSTSSSASNSQTATDGGCRDYPDVGFRVFPRAEIASTEGLPACVASCSTRRAMAGASPAPLDQDLPSGPCDDEGARCQSSLTAGVSGPCRDVGGPGNGYVCTCRNLRWQCAIAIQGGAIGGGPQCIGVPADCFGFTRTTNEICACGLCRKLCTTNADCPSGSCRVDALCFRSGECPGPDECTAPCTGFCL